MSKAQTDENAIQFSERVYQHKSQYPELTLLECIAVLVEQAHLEFESAPKLLTIKLKQELFEECVANKMVLSDKSMTILQAME